MEQTSVTGTMTVTTKGKITSASIIFQQEIEVGMHRKIDLYDFYFIYC